MSADLLGQLNWLAVIVAALVYFAIGAVWYVPFTPMGRTWAAIDAMRRMQNLETRMDTYRPSSQEVRMFERGQKVRVVGMGGVEATLIVWDSKPHGISACTEVGFELLKRGIEAPIVGYPARDVVGLA